jgi:hypothetical protein
MTDDASPRRARATFEDVGWDPGIPPSGEGPAIGPIHSSAVVRKEFKGDLEGTSVADLLMCQTDAADLARGAGYIASERVEGTLDGREGSFVMHHWGVSIDDARETGGHVVPGSGTGDLEGLQGQARISVNERGDHTLTLDYELPS